MFWTTASSDLTPAVLPSPQTTEAPIVTPVPAQFSNQTLRQIVHVSVAGSKLRLRLTNEFGTAPLVIGAVTVARQSTGAGIVPGSERKLSFGGQPSITIPAGAPALSDAVDFKTPALGNLAVSVYLPSAVPATTFHSLGLSTTYVSPEGDYSAAIELPVASTTLSWFFISGVRGQADGVRSLYALSIPDL